MRYCTRIGDGVGVATRAHTSHTVTRKYFTAISGRRRKTTLFAGYDVRPTANTLTVVPMYGFFFYPLYLPLILTAINKCKTSNPIGLSTRRTNQFSVQTDVKKKCLLLVIFDSSL